MELISNYYLGKDGFYLKSKWPKRIRATLAGAFAVFALTFTNDNMYANFRTTKAVYQEYIQQVNPQVSDKDARDISTAIIRWASEFDVDEQLLLAIGRVESAFNKHAISPSGAYGIMQVIPVWHKDKILEASKKLGNPEVFSINTNIYLGARVLKDCFSKTNDHSKALLCYSGQTAGYDKKVLSEYKAIQGL